MATGSPRSSAPFTRDPAAAEPSSVRDVTEPELALPIRRTPGRGIALDAVARARKPTLVSAIPALLAASMGEIREARNEATPLPVDERAELTCRLDESVQRSLLLEDDPEYIVEVGDPGRADE